MRGFRLKHFFRVRYPKLLILAFIIGISYFVFSAPAIQDFVLKVGGWGYLGMLIGGMMFSFGFSTPIAIGLFFTLHPQNIFLASLVGGLGALMSDLLIYKFVKISLMDEFEMLEKSRPMIYIEKKMSLNKLGKFKSYVSFLLAGFVIASPLPDEIGVGMLAGFNQVNAKILSLLSFFFNSLGIFLMLWASVIIG